MLEIIPANSFSGTYHSASAKSSLQKATLVRTAKAEDDEWDLSRQRGENSCAAGMVGDAASQRGRMEI